MTSSSLISFSATTAESSVSWSCTRPCLLIAFSLISLYQQENINPQIDHQLSYTQPVQLFFLPIPSIPYIPTMLTSSSDPSPKSETLLAQNILVQPGGLAKCKGVGLILLDTSSTILLINLCSDWDLPQYGNLWSETICSKLFIQITNFHYQDAFLLRY